MARSRRSPTPPPPAVTVDRASRLCRLLHLLGAKPQTRAVLLQRLKIDIRGFYRDLQLLREIGIKVELTKGRYALLEDAKEAVSRLPFPDPHLTLGEATLLGKGRNAIHRKIKTILSDIIPSAR